MHSSSPPTVLITGGSSGIGLALSRLFARDGYRLLWVALDQAELDQAAGDLRGEFPELTLHTLAKDLAIETSAAAVYTWAKEKGTVDVLVNNAGFGTYGYLQEIDLATEQRMLQLNVLNLYQLTRLFLGDMMARDAGHIINISSNTSLQPVPRMATYAATKAFVKHFSLSLRDEMTEQGSAVRVMTVCPSATRHTAFQRTAKMQGVRTFSSLTTSTPAEVAQDSYRGFLAGKRIVYSGAGLRRILWLQRLMPARVVHWALRRELDRKKGVGRGEDQASETRP